jgi:hypothetical protein
VQWAEDQVVRGAGFLWACGCVYEVQVPGMSTSNKNDSCFLRYDHLFQMDGATGAAQPAATAHKKPAEWPVG